MDRFGIAIMSVGAAVIGASTASASVIVPAPLAGYSEAAVLYGIDGVGRDQSRWFTSNETAQHTNWSNKPIDFQFDLGDNAAEYTIGVTGKNQTSLVLPSNYSQFKVGVTVNDQFLDYMYIAASDTEWNASYLNAGELSGDVTVTLNWVNDSYRAGEYDANFAVGSVQLLTFGAQQASAPLPPEIPAPGAGALACVGLFLAGPRRRRQQRA